jgi:hypothetical protein
MSLTTPVTTTGTPTVANPVPVQISNGSQVSDDALLVQLAQRQVYGQMTLQAALAPIPGGFVPLEIPSFLGGF